MTSNAKSNYINPLAGETTEKRIAVNFSGELYDTLMEVSRLRGKNVSDTIRAAITLQKFIEDARRDGYHVLLERNGTVKELVTL